MMTDRLSMDKKEHFTALYDKCFNYLYSYVFTRTAGDLQIVEEIVQETFTSAWFAYDHFDNRSTYGTWLCSIAKNKLCENYRRKATREKVELQSTDDEYFEHPSEFDIEKTILDNETRKQVLMVLNSINLLYRYALIMKYIDDYSVKEIAKILGRTPKAIDGILQRAKISFLKEYSKIRKSEQAYE